MTAADVDRVCAAVRRRHRWRRSADATMNAMPPAALRRHPGLQRGGRAARAVRAPLSGARRARRRLRGHLRQRRQPRPLGGAAARAVRSAGPTSRASCCSTPTTASTWRSSPASSACRGERVVTLDADLQNPPEEIGKLLAAMDAGHDYVGGVRRTREDSWWRRIASRAMNRLRERITRIRMTDQGCMLRAYSRDIVDAVAASREVSTFIPALAYTFAQQPDRSRGRARGARGRRVEVLALQAHPPQLRPRHRLFAGAAADLLDVRHAGVGRVARSPTSSSSSSALVVGGLARTALATCCGTATSSRSS